MNNKKNIVLKLSGEALGRPGDSFNGEAGDFICEEVLSIYQDFGVALVVGGGNVARGSEINRKFFNDRKTKAADKIGMLFTVANGLALQEKFEERLGRNTTRVSSEVYINQFCEPYNDRKSLSDLEKGRIIILVGGLGKPGFSTDTAMVQKSFELEAVAALKGTKVDGIFDKDPIKFSDAQFIPEISCLDYLNRKLTVIDANAITKAMEYDIEIKVFNFFEKGNLRRILGGENIGSVIRK